MVCRLLTVWEVGSAPPTLFKRQLYFQEGRAEDGESIFCYSLFSLQPDCVEGHAKRIQLLGQIPRGLQPQPPRCWDAYPSTQNQAGAPNEPVSELENLH